MGKYTFWACLLAVGLMFSSVACNNSNTDNSSSGSYNDSSITENASPEDSSDTSSQEKVEYKLLALQTSYSISVGDSVQLKIRLFINNVASPLEGVSFSSANPEIATVDDQGVVEAHKAGKVSISASIGSQYKTVTINVENVARDLELDNTRYALSLGASKQVEAQAFKEGTLDQSAVLAYKMEDTSVATVSTNGLIVGVASGETILNVTYSTVTVKVPVIIYAETTATNVNSFSETYINTYGRTYIENNKLNLDHVASAVEVAIVGTSLTVNLHTTATLYIRVFVDEEATGERFEVKSSQTSYTVASGLSEGYHKIRIVKSSELFDGQIDVVSFSADKFAVAPTKGKIKIEFIGDSITAGYGVLGPSGATRTVENSDGCYSFAYQTAQKLNADYSTIAVQGICTMAYHWNKTWNMYSLYQNVSANFNSAKYDFSFNPDVVVLGLGTNDASYLQPSYGGSSYGTQFPSDYKKMLELIRENNPDAYIVCVYGMMGTNSVISSGIENAIREMNDDKITHIFYTADTSGAHGHPSISGNASWSTSLAESIKELLEN